MLLNLRTYFQANDDNQWLVGREVFCERFCFRFETEPNEYLLICVLE